MWLDLEMLFVLFFISLPLVLCDVHNNGSLHNVSVPTGGPEQTSAWFLLAEGKPKSSVMDVDIMKWLDNKSIEKDHRVSLAFLPGLAILCLLVACCFKCCGWFREHVKDRHMDEENEYTIVTENDSDFMNVDFRSDTASAIYYDTVTSYYSFIKRNNLYDTVNSYRSLNLRNNDCPRRTFSQRVGTEMRDQSVQVNFVDESKKRYQKMQRSLVKGKRFGRFEVIPTNVNSGVGVSIPVSVNDKSSTTLLKQSLVRSLSVGASGTPTSQRKLQKLKVSFDINKNDQYKTVPAVSTFVTAADIEPRSRNVVRCNSGERILPSNRNIVNGDHMVQSTGNIMDTGKINRNAVFNAAANKHAKQTGTEREETTRVGNSLKPTKGCGCNVEIQCVCGMRDVKKLHSVEKSAFVYIPKLPNMSDHSDTDISVKQEVIDSSGFTSNGNISSSKTRGAPLAPLLSECDTGRNNITSTNMPKPKSSTGGHAVLLGEYKEDIPLDTKLPNGALKNNSKCVPTSSEDYAYSSSSCVESDMILGIDSSTRNCTISGSKGINGQAINSSGIHNSLENSVFFE